MAFDEWQRREIFARADARCEHCGASWYKDFVMLECDHIVPLSDGGANTTANGQLLCRPCHAKKHANQAREAKRRGDKRSEQNNARAAASIGAKPRLRTGY